LRKGGIWTRPGVNPGVYKNAKGISDQVHSTGIEAFTILATGAPTPTYGASGLPGGLTVNPVSGVITGVPSTNGLFLANLLALNSAGTGTSPVAFIIESSPPVEAEITSSLAEVSIEMRKEFSYTITANNDPTEYEAQGLPGGLSLNKSTGVISGRPNRAGTYRVTLQAVHRVTGEQVTTATGTKVIRVVAPF